MKYSFLPILSKTILLAGILLCFLLPEQTVAQQGKPYLDSLLQSATANYPLLKAKRLQTKALKYAVKYKQNGLIPSFNASYQVDYATANNITGMIYPQYITPISGPPSKGNDYSGVPGSAAALNLQWEPITFGQRGAEINLARGQLQYGQADENLTLFQHHIHVIAAWLNYLLVNDLIRVYKSNIDRSTFNLKQAQTLVSSGLRPGTDSSSFHSEYTRAQMQLIAFERQRDSTLIALKELVGGHLPVGTPEDSSLFSKLPVIAMLDTPTADHPEVQLGKANVRANELALKSLRKNIMPRLSFWSTGYGRGSGIDAGGGVNSSDGWRFQRYNYGVGAQLSFSILEVIRQKPLRKQQEFITESSREQLAQTELHLNMQKEIAVSNFQKAIQSVLLAPQQFHSARYSYSAIQSRYRSGLINYYDVIQAQQLLFQSEATVKIAYYNVWRALLNEAAYSGNLNLFLNQYDE